MHLAYDGTLWTGGVLERVLDDEVRRARVKPRASCSSPRLKRPSARRSSVERHAEALAERLARQRLGRAGPGRRAARRWSSSACVVPGGISSTWWVTSTNGGLAGLRRQLGERRDELLAPAEVEPGGRLVEQDHARIVHQRAGQQHALAFAGRQRRRAAGRRARPTPMRARQSTARSRSASVYRCHHGSSAAYLAVITTSTAVSARPQLGRQRRPSCSRPVRRSTRTSVRPSVSPSTRTVPCDGCSYTAAIRSSVDLPLPLAPSTTQRSRRADVEASRRRGSACRRARTRCGRAPATGAVRRTSRTTLFISAACAMPKPVP